MVHMVQQEPSLSPAEKTFFRLTCAGEGRVSSYWWHQGDAYLSSYCDFIIVNSSDAFLAIILNNSATDQFELGGLFFQLSSRRPDAEQNMVRPELQEAGFNLLNALLGGTDKEAVPGQVLPIDVELSPESCHRCVGI